ncbi:oligosaccharide flippase family protein [Microbacterium sp. Se63.02b]|nr:oligosaccharide flippase family protein [Microbacterium sp. Se63.02b]
MIAQALTLVILPILTRIYSTEDFGALTLVTSITMLVTTFSTLRLETALMLPTAHRDVRALVSLSLLSASIVATITALIVFFIGLRDPAFDIHTGLPLWVFLSILLSAVYTVLNRLALRKGGYSEVGKRAVAQAIGTGGAQLALNPFPGGSLGLIVGSLIGRLFGLVPLYRYSRGYIGRTHRKIKIKVLREYWRFPVFFAPSAALNAFGVQAPLLFVTAWYGVAFAGILGVAERVIGIPMTLIGNAVAQVFDGEMARKIRAGRGGYVRPYMKVSLWLGVVALGVGAGFYLLGDWAVPIILGQEWALAGHCVSIMSITVAFRLVASPTSRVIGLFQRAGGMFVIDVCRSLSMLGAIAWVMFTQAPFLVAVSVMYYSLALIYVVTWVYALIVVVQESRKSERSVTGIVA